MTASTLGLDADGVLVDYHAGYRAAWHKAFGEWLKDVHPRRYHAQERFAAPMLSESAMAHLRLRGFDEETWYRMPLLPGAREACQLLADSGYRLEVVSALPPAFGAARLAGLRAQGVPAAAIHAVGGDTPPGNPKRAAVESIRAVAMVDDYAPFLEGLPPTTRRVLIDGGWEASPNATYKGEPVDEVHGSLLAFARAWCSGSSRYTAG